MVRPFPGALPLHPPRSPCRGHARRAASPTGREGRSALLPRHPILLGLPALAKGSLRPPWIPGIARTMVALQPTSSFVSWRCPRHDDQRLRGGRRCITILSPCPLGETQTENGVAASLNDLIGYGRPALEPGTSDMSSHHRAVAGKVASRATPATVASVAQHATNATYADPADRYSPSGANHAASIGRRSGQDFDTELHQFWSAYREELTRVLVLLRGELSSAAAWALEFSLARFPQPKASTLALGEDILKMLILEDLPVGHVEPKRSQGADDHHDLAPRVRSLRADLEGVLSACRLQHGAK